jgi:crossover junction endodeoxyribonuclease RuvC
MMILGIDPGLLNTGWAVIQKTKDGKFRFFESGTIKTQGAKQHISERLGDIGNGISNIFNKFTIDTASIEEVFVNKNNLSSLKLGHARGAIILALAQNNLKVSEYSATNVKKAITGTGRADKHQIIAMTKILVPKADCKNDHEADALAVAICHANSIF